MSSDMALRFSGLLKVMTPTPSAIPCRILPSAKDLSAFLRTSSIGAAFGDWGLKRLDGSTASVSRQWRCAPTPQHGAIANGIFLTLAFQPVVPANAGTHR